VGVTQLAKNANEKITNRLNIGFIRITIQKLKNQLSNLKTVKVGSDFVK
jgi:hypothetical protein